MLYEVRHPMDDWGKRVKEYRSRNGLTQQALADDLGVDRTTIIRWEQGKDEPALMYRRKILAWAPTVPEGVVRGLIDVVDHMDGFATLLDSQFRVLRTSKRHQQLLGYEGGDIYGMPSERFWSAEMTQIIKRVGGLRGYRKNGIHAMDLALVRRPDEKGSFLKRPIASIGRTVAIGDPRDPICHFTTLTVTEDLSNLPVNRLEGLDGPIQINLRSA